MMKEAIQYHLSDAHIVDYEIFELPGVEGSFRGPPLKGGPYIACVGAAQTFGRFVREPFPNLLSKALDTDVLNLGRGGRGPTFHASSEGLLDYINGAALVVVQVLSGRSQSNSLFQTTSHGMVGLSGGQDMSADDFYRWLLRQEPDLVRSVVAETRANYVADMKSLLAAIRPPKILFWFSVRRPKYEERLELPPPRLLGAAPQLVNEAMVEALRPFADRYVECASRTGMPQKLFDKAGAPTHFMSGQQSAEGAVMKSENAYYPSPEMHEEAAALLAPVCRELLGRQAG